MNFRLVAGLLIGAIAADGADFAILGDRTGNAVPGVYPAVCKEVAAHHPDFVINVGDTIEGMNDATAAEQWKEIRPVWRVFGNTPFYLVPGNHDIWSPASERIWKEQTGHPAHYSFSSHGVHVTVLDNARAEIPSPEEMKFLEEDLASHASEEPKFIFFHRPFWLLPVKFQNGNFPLHALARKYGVGFVVSGHAHEFDRSELQGVHYIMVGSSGGSLTHGKSPAKGAEGVEGLYFGYAWVHLEGRGAKLEFRRVEP